LRLVPNVILQFFTKDEHVKQLENLLGFSVGKITLYELALCHRSSNSTSTDNNERLEYLGDAMLGAIIGEYLYKKYPTQPEGFLTEMRSKIVNRQSLNDIALRLGLKQIVKYNKSDQHLRSSQIFGNALEALIGAIYIDKGYPVTRKFIQSKIISLYVDMDSLEMEESNLKNKLIGWANKNKQQISFVVVDEVLDNRKRIFTIGVQLDDQLICKASATNKKEASKRAAKEALDVLGIQ
jgi:ribonuclease III